MMNKRVNSSSDILGKAGFWLLWVFVLCMLLAACRKDETAPIRYEEVSSVVGPEGKTLRFFEDKQTRGREIPITLYPTLVFEPQTFSTPAVIRLDVQKMSFTTLPPGLTPVSANTCKWTVISSIPGPDKAYRISIPFEPPADGLWLEKYQQLYTLYKIPVGTETNRRENWTEVTDAVLDLVNRTYSADVQDFSHAYCVLFGEVFRNDNIALSSEGAINTIQAGAVTQYFASTNALTQGFHYRNNISSYTYQGVWNEDFLVSFSFNGDAAGTYSGNSIQVKYCYKKSTNGWTYEFAATDNTVITITDYGNIGEAVKGNISGELVNGSHEKIAFTMDFTLIRTR